MESTEKKIKLEEIKELREVQGHTSYIFSLCLIDANRIASCSRDGLIKIWDIKTYQCLSTLKGHNYNVNYISLLSSGSLVSCSDDGRIKVWDINNNKCLSTLSQHKDAVFKVCEIRNNQICSCSADHTLMVFNASPPYNLMHTLKGHEYSVYSFLELKSKNYILSSSSEEIMISSTESFQKETIIKSIISSGNGDNLVELNDQTVIFGSSESILVMDASTFQIKNSIRINGIDSSWIFCLVEVSNGVVVCGTSQGELVEIDVSHNQVIGIKKNAHQNQINSLMLLNKRILVSCSNDLKIKFWG